VPAIVYSCYFFGDQIHKAVSVIKNVEQAIVALIGLGVLYFLVKYVVRKVRQARSSEES
jgi:membrane protein DedA with SNARE-associated domain